MSETDETAPTGETPSLFPDDEADDSAEWPGEGEAPGGGPRVAHERVYLGSAGWSYDDWDAAFYPPGLPARDRLSYYASRYRSVEIDSTFYGTPSLSTVQRWYERTPDDFLFSAKFPRAITHEARLVDCADETYRFVESMGELGEKLGPLLLQLPPSFRVDRFDDLALFLQGLPDGLVYAVEIRDRSWLVEEFADLLRQWNVALVMSCGGNLQRFWRVTSRVAYIRWLGDFDAFDTFDSVRVDRSEEIDWWVPRIRHFVDHGGLVFGYVNNHYAGFSPTIVDQIKARLSARDG